MSFPQTRLRRLRKTKNLRRLLAEHSLSVDDVIFPLFICPGSKVKKEISSMPGIFQISPDQVISECQEIVDLGIPGVLLFGLPEYKDAEGSSSCQEDGVVQQSIRLIKKAFPDLLISADVCFCEYTDHGHCGVLQGQELHNDATLVNLKNKQYHLQKQVQMWLLHRG